MAAMLDDETKGFVIQHGCHTIVFWISSDLLQATLYSAIACIGEYAPPPPPPKKKKKKKKNPPFVTTEPLAERVNMKSLVKNKQQQQNRISGKRSRTIYNVSG